jgi:hypothetical protein
MSIPSIHDPYFMQFISLEMAWRGSRVRNESSAEAKTQ